MPFSTPLRRTCMLIFLAIAIIGCQSVVDSGYGEKVSLIGRMSVPEIEDALQVWADSVSLSVYLRALAKIGLRYSNAPLYKTSIDISWLQLLRPRALLRESLLFCFLVAPRLMPFLQLCTSQVHPVSRQCSPTRTHTDSKLALQTSSSRYALQTSIRRRSR